MSKEREAALRIISFNEMNGNGENDAIDEVCVARAYLALSGAAPNPAGPKTEMEDEMVSENEERMRQRLESAGTDNERKLIVLLERCYSCLVGYNPETGDGPVTPESRAWLVREIRKMQSPKRKMH